MCTFVHFKMPRICITGGGGYLGYYNISEFHDNFNLKQNFVSGQCLAKALEADGHFIVLFDLRFSHFPNISLNSDRVLKVQVWIDCLRVLKRRTTIWIMQGTILDQIAMKEALDGCEVCFHLAAYGMSGGASVSD